MFPLVEPWMLFHISRPWDCSLSGLVLLPEDAWLGQSLSEILQLSILW